MFLMATFVKKSSKKKIKKYESQAQAAKFLIAVHHTLGKTLP